MSQLNESDVFTLLGHAVILKMNGGNDMPAYFFGLAERLAITLEDVTAAEKVRAVAKRFEGPAGRSEG